MAARSHVKPNQDAKASPRLHSNCPPPAIDMLASNSKSRQS